MTDDEIIDSMFEVETVSVRTVNRVPPDPACVDRGGGSSGNRLCCRSGARNNPAQAGSKPMVAAGLVCE